MNFKTEFAENLRKVLNQPGAMKKSELARRVNKSRGYVSELLSGRAVGSEMTRREIAAALGKTYEELIGVEQGSGQTKKYIQDIPRSRVVYTHRPSPDLIKKDVAEAFRSNLKNCWVLPVVTLDVIFRGGLYDAPGQFFGWHVSPIDINEDIISSVVAISMPDASLNPAIPQGTVLLVNIVSNNYNKIAQLKDNDFYVMDCPSTMPIRQVFHSPVDKDIIILSSIGTKGPAAPQILKKRDLGCIHGHVIAMDTVVMQFENE